MKHIVSRTVCGALSAVVLTSAALATSITPSKTTIELPKGQNTFTFDIHINADNAFAGAEFGLKPSSSKAKLSIDYVGDFDNVSPVSTVKEGIYYFGFFKSAKNEFAGKTDHTVATVTCEYAGDEDITITMVSSDVVSVDTENKTTIGDDTAAAFTINVDREGGSSSGGGSSTGGGTDIGEGDTPLGDLPFIDVKADDWFAESVKYVVDNKLMNGVATDRFAPLSNTTRGMIVTILYREAGSPAVESDDATWWSDARVWAMDKGVSDGTNMEGLITREQLAAMLYRYTGSPAVSGSITGFSDTDKVSEWAEQGMLWAVKNGIINGSNGKLNPQGYATRAEVAAMLMRFCELKK